MVQLCYKHIRVILAIATLAVCSVITYAGIRYWAIHSAKEPAIKGPEQAPARISLKGEFTRFDAPGGNFSDVYRFTDPENGNMLYWWGGTAVVIVPGRETR